MHTITDSSLNRLKLMHLVTPSLPLGSFAYSQGLEWAVEDRWVKHETELLQWTENLLQTSLTHLDLPLLQRLYESCENRDLERFSYWSRYLTACRETRELREEETNRARALAALLPQWEIPTDDAWLEVIKNNHLSGYAFVAHHWRIGIQQAAEGYLWSWLENITLAGVKIIPLGQMAGQRILQACIEQIPALVKTGLSRHDEEIGHSSPAQAIASSLHETQYTRIYRS
ncbi:MAG: urease accessory protein UreF [Candidatus Thiodiazotropha weberae]|nr:urease accessory protein UreF [Candidatus Thiodiazotropha weberae]